MPKFRDTVIHDLIYELILDQKWVGVHFGRFFWKPIWSPWFYVEQGTWSRQSAVDEWNEWKRLFWVKIFCDKWSSDERKSELAHVAQGRAGLPDGVFSNPKSKCGYILEGLTMDNVGIIYCHLEYFTPTWSILWPFGNVVVIWYIFTRFGILCIEKSGNPDDKRKLVLQNRWDGWGNLE
jgi:hypothetical protein